MDKNESGFSIGYGKPPRHTQFQPGQSGNPQGRRRKKATTLVEMIEKELNTMITAHEGEKRRRMTKREAIAKQQTNMAVKGDLKAMALLLKALKPRESEQAEELSPILQAMRAIHAKHEATDQDGK